MIFEFIFELILACINALPDTYLDSLDATWLGDTLDWLLWGNYYLPLDTFLTCASVILIVFVATSIVHVVITLL